MWHHFTQGRNVITMSKQSKGIQIGGAVLIALLFASFFIKLPVLAVETEEQFYWTATEEFSISWIHSVEKEEWVEFYETKEKELLLTRTSFKTFGAGVPSTPADAKTTTLEDGFVTMQIDRILPTLQLVVSDNVKSTLLLSNQAIPLYTLTENYSTVSIYATHLSFWERVFKGVKL